MNLVVLLVIAVGGAIGSVCRYLMASGVQKVAHFAFPIGTLTVNIIGSMIVGLISGYIMNMQTHPLIRPALIVGFCGGFTTFSTFSFETFGLIDGGEWGRALLYAVASVVACVGGAALGFVATRAHG